MKTLYKHLHNLARIAKERKERKRRRKNSKNNSYRKEEVGVVTEKMGQLQDREMVSQYHCVNEALCDVCQTIYYFPSKRPKLSMPEIPPFQISAREWMPSPDPEAHPGGMK